jgi:septal ring factor EnvC (AmiA/AmiB activator)
MTTGAVPNSTAAATDQDRQRATAERAEQMSREQAAAQRSTTTTTTTSTSPNQRMVQADGLWKPERILLKGVTKAELESAPAFNWDSNANTPARNR